MNAKLKKIVKITAAALFLIALVININWTLDDPFSMVNKQVLAQTSSESDSSGGGGSGYSCSATAYCYYGSRREGEVSCTGDKNCESTFEKVTCDGNISYCS